MTHNRRLFVALTACLCLTASTVALAGQPSSGTKRDPIIRVENNRGFPLGVLVNPSQAQIAQAEQAQTTQQFEAAGGRIINADAYQEYTVKAGNNRIVLVNLLNLEYDILDVNLVRGETRVFQASDLDY